MSRTAAMRAVEVEASDGIRNTDEIVSEVRIARSLQVLAEATCTSTQRKGGPD